MTGSFLLGYLLGFFSMLCFYAMNRVGDTYLNSGLDETLEHLRVLELLEDLRHRARVEPNTSFRGPLTFLLNSSRNSSLKKSSSS